MTVQSVSKVFLYDTDPARFQIFFLEMGGTLILQKILRNASPKLKYKMAGSKLTISPSYYMVYNIILFD